MKGFKGKPKKGKNAKHSNSEASQVQVGKNFNGPQLSFKKILVGLALITLIALMGWGVYSYLHKESKTQSSTTCSQATITAQTAADLTNPKSAVLKPTVDKIVARSDYATDINCVYVLTAYYVATGDPAKARPAYDKLTKLYSSRSDYNDMIKDVAGSPDRFKPILEMLEQQQKDIDKTSRIMNR